MQLRIFLVLISSLALIGCGSSASVSRSPAPSPTPATTSARTVYVPPGVDSSAAIRADSIADESFVSLQKEKQANELAEQGQRYVSLSDTLWKFLEMGNDTTKSVSQEDSIAALKPYNEGAKAFRQFFQIRQTSELDSTKLVVMQDSLLSRAQKSFERAIQINPYDDEARFRLSQVYRLRAQRLSREDDYYEAIKILERLTRLRKDQPGLYNALANSYYSTEQWTEAAENYSKARKVYMESAELSLDSTAQLDSTRVYSYLTAEADAHRNARNASASIEAFQQALDYATTEDQYQFVQGEIEWINWDDGNIASSFTRDSLAALANQGKFEAAVEGFRSLKPQLTTQQARDEIDWRLAQAEYQIGEQDRAAERLQALYKRTEKQSDGTPVDSTYQQYFNDYAAICYNLGREKLDENRRTALKYFEQSVRVPWSQRGLSALEAAKILRNNTKRSIEYLNTALKHEEDLSLEDRKQLYQLLTNQHRKLGQREQARRYYGMYRDITTQSRAKQENE